MKRRAFLQLVRRRIGLDTQPVEHGQHQRVGRAPMDSLDDGASLDQQSFGLGHVGHGLHGDALPAGSRLWDPRTDEMDLPDEGVPLTLPEWLLAWGCIALAGALWAWLVVSAWRWVMG